MHTSRVDPGSYLNRRNPDGGKPKFGGDFFSLKPFQSITTNISPKLRKSNSGGSRASSHGESRSGSLIESLRRYSRQSSKPASSKDISSPSDSSKLNSPMLLSPMKAIVRILSYNVHSRNSSCKTAASPVAIDPTRAESLAVISPISPSCPCPPATATALPNADS
jgi:hypothetical protein